MRVFVLDAKKRPLDPCHPARARQLLKSGRAAVFRRYPFTIILRDRLLEDSTTHPHRIKIDPGAKASGVALVREDIPLEVWAAEVEHRGEQIHRAMVERAQHRRFRRYRKVRYRKPRFSNRRPEKCASCGRNSRKGSRYCRPCVEGRNPRDNGFRKTRLPPSLESRVANLLTWVKRLVRLCPVGAISVELAKFDAQKLQNPEISGVEYQRGELFGYEVREYLLEKWGRRCVYCGKQGIPLEIDHIIPRSRGGTDRVSNLTLACRECNQAKGNRTAAEFGHAEVQEAAGRPLEGAAVVNATRWELYRRLRSLGLSVEAGTGGRTKYNRTRLGLLKGHCFDACCVGESTPEGLRAGFQQVLVVKACGHGRRCRANVDRFGFPVSYAPRRKSYMGFRTGDLVRAVVPRGKYAGVHVGRVAVRFRPSFKLNGFDVHPKYLTILQRSDGYEYGYRAAHSPFQ
ncbi:MAG: RNA-guided endonuclease IscB [Moorellales bacterium]